MRNKRKRAQAPPAVPEEKLTSQIAKFLEVPEPSVSDVASIELSGNTEAVIDGCKGVIEYSEEIIRLNTGRMVVRVTGRGLQLKGMTAQSVVISGYILSLEFIA